MLPFTREILFASFAVYNEALWPFLLLVLAIAGCVLLLALRPVRHGDRVIAASLAAAWLWTGYGYFFLHHADLNFLAPVYAVVFVLQAFLLAWSGLVRNRLAFGFRGDPFGWVGVALAAAAIAVWPLADRLIANDWESVRIVGVAPAPTVVLTLGLLLLAPGRTPLHLLAIPLLWTIAAGATAWALTIPHDLALPALGVLAIALVLRKNRGGHVRASAPSP